jgi:hypothetical protein
VKHSFQKNSPHSPEPPVDNNTGTKVSEPACRKVCGFFVNAPAYYRQENHGFQDGRRDLK